MDNAPRVALLVEDGAVVRRACRRSLESLGFQVLEAESADEALSKANAFAGSIALLIADVVLPGMGSRRLATSLRAKRPQLRVLLMSGYAKSELTDLGELDPELPFLQKPFTREGLAQAVEHALEARSALRSG